jgi:hypothetical protein
MEVEGHHGELRLILEAPQTYRLLLWTEELPVVCMKPTFHCTRRRNVGSNILPPPLDETPPPQTGGQGFLRLPFNFGLELVGEQGSLRAWRCSRNRRILFPPPRHRRAGSLLREIFGQVCARFVEFSDRRIRVEFCFRMAALP